MNKIKSISEDLLSDGLAVRIPTIGTSMFPLMKTGDKAIISLEKNPNAGDIIVFTRGHYMVCHRLVRVFEKDGTRYFQTQGDSFFCLDEPVTADRILGKVIRIEREKVSLPRRILLVIHPLLRFWRLNAITISVLVRIKKYLTSAKTNLVDR